MAFSAVPTPLYAIYAARDGLTTVQITLIYAVYAAGVILSLFFGGHVSDRVGRKVVFVPALLVNVLSAAVFVLWPSFIGLMIARIISGISIGLTTATATAYLSELHLGATADSSSRRSQVIATAANLGGIGVGPLVAGVLAQYAPYPLQLSYIVVGVAIAALAIMVALSPETVVLPEPVPAYRPQRVVVPREARGTFFGATAAGISAFAVYGLFNSLVPSFLANTMHETSHAVAGLVAFAAFAAGAVAQITFSRWTTRMMLIRSVGIVILGLALFTGGMWLPNVALFIVGGIITGAGAGLLFRAALVTAGSAAAPEARAEVLAGFFLGAYIGLSVPVIGLGIATEYWPATDALLAFVALVVIAMIFSVRGLTRTPELPTPQGVN
ncbi:MAG: putative arabinose efflux permease, family [Microbacteriaceae bacterium]|jgi:MFS family permease|nr:putative arabinose efflux permease, family [Microbacteriaceae bacterium]